MQANFQTLKGTPLPYGVTKIDGGYNFSLFSKHALSVTLVLFDEKNNHLIDIALDPKLNKTGDLWHIIIPNLSPNFRYGYRLEGPFEPSKGLYFDPKKVVIDPFAKLVATDTEFGKAHYHSNTHTAIIDGSASLFNWEEDTFPRIPLKNLIIYEMHVRGFTQDATSEVKNPGTFLGIIEKIPYLKELGINAIELMPIFEFDENDNTHTNPSTQKPLHNYWGYSTVNFFSPMNRYGTETALVIKEFKTLVRELHKNGIEVILDVVYNHTAEGNEKGPTLSFKGIAGDAYYMLTPEGHYHNFSGCGNTMNANHPIVRELIKKSLHYWVEEMHVDGFRFDLASILTRAEDGSPLKNPPLVEELAKDPLLADTKLIAEAWDAGGLYQVGSFPSWGVWAEWNGKFRDDIRDFLKGTDGAIGGFATRLCGSEDLYSEERLPYHSINFITSHDGFTLKDLVSYNEKHNEDNGEGNRDGDTHNRSWNCGHEGETLVKKTLTLRKRQIRNFFMALMISQGVPMLLMGDEYGHTKRGNNNSWCHDGPINWFGWDKLKINKDFFKFCKSMIAFRKKHPILYRSRFLTTQDITWHGKIPSKPDWGNKSRFLAFTLVDPIDEYDLYVAFNAGYESALINLPSPRKGQNWTLIVDTSRASPDDFIEEEKAMPLIKAQHRLPPHSSLLLKSKPF
ncbi:MAG: glycogen debranching protein GlgX [Chlamydiia bacterium]|nr:glycogen debranching protein GlgX [Chlamydiia bacterium]